MGHQLMGKYGEFQWPRQTRQREPCQWELADHDEAKPLALIYNEEFEPIKDTSGNVTTAKLNYTPKKDL